VTKDAPGTGPFATTAGSAGTATDLAYLAPEGFEEELAAELGPNVIARHGRLFLARPPARDPAWVQNTWREPVTTKVASIGEASRLLRSIQRNWHPYAFHLHRRTQLLVEKLPPIRFRPHRFPAPAPSSPLGAFAFLDQGTLLHSRSCSSPFPNGEAQFEEDREAPPSRAYLKLWEALTIAGVRPGPGERCIDLGSSPGGWTWVLASLGAEVVSVDKADLAPAVAAMPNVRFERGSAFAVDPRRVRSRYDWLFCDVICYPDRLLGMIERWRDAQAARRFVCTVKFQGRTDHAAIARFAAIPGAKMVHLFHNRHELTFLLV
jgi:23S rRNA (cytidine2498-2'-O)-methyltransferase